MRSHTGPVSRDSRVALDGKGHTILANPLRLIGGLVDTTQLLGPIRTFRDYNKSTGPHQCWSKWMVNRVFLVGVFNSPTKEYDPAPRFVRGFFVHHQFWATGSNNSRDRKASWLWRLRLGTHTETPPIDRLRPPDLDRSLRDAGVHDPQRNEDGRACEHIIELHSTYRPGPPGPSERPPGNSKTNRITSLSSKKTLGWRGSPSSGDVGILWNLDP